MFDRKFFHTRLAAVAAAASLFGSCTAGKGEPQPAGETAVLQLEKKLVVAEVTGGTYCVGLRLTTPEGDDVQTPDLSLFRAECEESWCGDFVFDEKGTSLSFNVLANTSAESRLTKVAVSYGESEAAFSLSQPGAGENADAVADMDFDISYEIDGPHVKMTVVPEFDYVRYYIAYSKKSEVDRYKDNIQSVVKANVEKFLSGEINALVNYGGYTFEAALDEYTGKGTRTVSMSLNGESDFVGWCCAVSNEAKVISAVVMKEFRTGSIPPSDNELTVEIKDVNCDRVTYSVGTTCDDQWASIVVPSEDVEGLTDKEIGAMFNTSEDVTAYLHFGPWSGSVTGLEQDRSYCVLVFGYSWGAVTTSVSKETIRTLVPEEGIPSFSFDVTKVTHCRAVCTVSPSLKTKLYYADVLLPGETVASAVKDIETQVDWMVQNDYGDRISIMKRLGSRGNETIEKTQLYEGQAYRFFAVPVDEATGLFEVERDGQGNVIESSVACSEVFETPFGKTSTASITVRHDKWYSGDEYAQKFPEEGAGAEGYAMLPVSVVENGNVADYWYCIYGADLTDTSKYPDSEIIRHLVGYTYTDDNGNTAEYEPDGIKNISEKVIACEYDKTLTLVSVVYDEDDNWSVVTREKLYLTREGNSPVSDID